ncbi:MAG: elongation factor-1 alpha, partial [Nitrospirales bacterium]
PYSQRALYTATLLILGLGYLFALLNIYFTYAGRAGGNPLLLTVEDIVVAYSGSGKGSRLEGALMGPMSTMLPADERSVFLVWAQAGTNRAVYERDIRPILDRRCMTCHDGSNPHLPNLSGYDNLKKVTEKDSGANISTLVRVSHIHLFGLTFIFFIVGLMYSHAYVRPVWFKCTIIAFPYFAIVLDVSSWYFTKLYHPFAWVVVGAGALMGLCFAFMWVTTISQMWFTTTPSAIIQRKEGDIPIIG